MFEQSVLTGAYHVRDDGMLLYSAIKSYVEEYVQHYYGEYPNDTNTEVGWSPMVYLNDPNYLHKLTNAVTAKYK